MELLEVYRDGEHVGQFARTKGRISFHYDSPNTAAPISLSLPPRGRHTANAARSVLENLLPDNRQVRAAWARKLDVPDTGFDLLAHVGEDVAGALTLLPEGASPSPQPIPAKAATDDEIAERILALHQHSHAWVAPEQLGRQRMSLAGAQGKFTLARVGETWFWPNAHLPSTHIFKPPHQTLRGIPELESGSLLLARELGLAAPQTRVIQVLGQPAYLVERFDREARAGTVRRRHTEDFAQALGLPPEQKYRVTAKQILQLLTEHAPQQRYAFVEQLAFNAALGNADAHGKNYSVYLDRDVTLTPLYDAVPTLLWPQYDSRVAMKIGGANRPQELTLAHWRKFARANQLDPDRVAAIAERIAAGIATLGHDVYRRAGAADSELQRVQQLHAATTAQVASPPAATQYSGGLLAAKANVSDPNRAGKVFVRPHLRNGRLVAGHWRKR